MHQDGIYITKMFCVLKSNSLNILKITSSFVVFAIIYCIFATPIYTARTIVNPPKLNEAGNNVSKNLGDMSDLDFSYSWSLTKTDANVIIALCKTDQLKNLIANKFNLMKANKLKNMEQARAMVSSMTRFTPDLQSGFLEIYIDSPSPVLAADIANYYHIAIGEIISKIAYDRTVQKQQFFLQQLDKTRENLHQAQINLKNFAIKNGISSGQQMSIVANLATQLQAQLVVAKSQLQAMALYATPDNPDYKNLQATVNSLDKQVNDVNGQGGVGSTTSQLPIPSHLAPELASEYDNLQRDVMLNEEILKVLFRAYENSKIEGYSQMIPTSLEVVDPAIMPEHPSKPKKIKIILAALLLGITLSSLYYIIRNKKQFIVEA